MGSQWLIRCTIGSALLLATGGVAAQEPADGATAREMTCRMEFSLHSWAVVVKHVGGEGTVTCSDGQTMNVKLDANGAGLTIGKAKIAKGTAKFTGMTSIHDVLGSYVGLDSTTAVNKVGGSGQAFTNGPVSMVLYGKSQGVSLGTAIEGLTIKAAE